MNVTNREVYGAHYDNGRITRTTDMDPVWARISKESQIRYRALESCSGIMLFVDGNELQGDSFEFEDGRILIYFSIGIQYSIF